MLEPEMKKTVPASARKTSLKSAVQNSSVKAGIPKKTTAGAGLRLHPECVRKFKVPAHLKQFEGGIVPAVSGRKPVAPKKKEPEAVPMSCT